MESMGERRSMPRIVHIQLKKSRPERFLLTLDDETEVLVAPETVIRHRLTLNLELEEETLLRILREDAVQRAKDQALRFLERRAHSEWELTRKLRQKGYDEAAVQAALTDLKNVGLVDDADFARRFVENEMVLRPAGRRLLRQKLRERGIPEEIFHPLLEAAYRRQPEPQIARKLAEKYRKRHPGEKGRKLQIGLGRYLQAKGFDWEVIQEVLQEYC